MNHLGSLVPSPFTRRSKNKRSKQRRALALQSLEDRTVPAQIVWVNRLSSSDTFTAAERAVIDEAINIWENIIRDFDNVSSPYVTERHFEVDISGGSTSGLDLGGTTSGRAFSYSEDGDTPEGACIEIDADAGTGSNSAASWYIDPNPTDHIEFTNLVTPFAANSGPAGIDMLSVAVHELGHALGIAASYDALDDRLSTNANGTRTFTGNNSRTATFVPSNQGTHLQSAAHPNDLMNTSMSSGQRFLPTDLDALIMADSFNYQIDLPSTSQSFLVDFNNQTGALVVRGDPVTLNDSITIVTHATQFIFDYIYTIDVRINGQTNRFAASQITSITVNAGGGNDTINLESLPGDMPTLPVTLNGDSGNDNINISPTVRNLASFLTGTNLVINGGTNTDTLTMNDRNGGGGTYTITDANVQKSNGVSIGYGSNVESLVVNTSDGWDTIQVRSTSSSTPVRVNAGNGTDTFIVGNTSNTLANIRTILSLYGEGATNSLQVRDQGSTTGKTYSITPSVIEWTGASPRINHWSMTSLTVNTSGGNDTINVTDISAAIPLTLNAGGGTSDTLRSTGRANAWVVSSGNAGSLNSATTFSNVENLTGGSFNDTFQFREGAAIGGAVTAGLGTDTLDYTNYHSTFWVMGPLIIANPVTVNLSTNTASGTNSAAGIENVTGGIGNDLMVGNAQSNVFNGGAGRDVLIGGAGADVLIGGADDDLLLSATTSYDNSPSALTDIMNEWGSTRMYDQRVANLRSGVGATLSTRLTSTTVSRDTDADVLTGGSGDHDWFWATTGFIVVMPGDPPPPPPDMTDRVYSFFTPADNEYLN